MLVLETIMPPKDWSVHLSTHMTTWHYMNGRMDYIALMWLGMHSQLLPANPSSITFSGVKVNGIIPPWTPRAGMTDCNQKVAKIDRDMVS
jgi:hypothetical protein